MKIGRLVFSIILGLALTAGCRPSPGDGTARLDQEFILSVGREIRIEGEELGIRFVEVTADSRCPRDVTCVTAGEVKCLIEITYFKSLHRITLTQLGLTSAPARQVFREYQLTFNVEPYPEAGKEIPASEYRLRMTVSKWPQLSGGILVTFQVIDEPYRVFITNKATIEQVFAVQRGESRATIPSGRLVRGPVFYNEPWSWHIDSEDISMAEFTIELCDGKPSMVEKELGYWVDTVRRFCPWQAKIVDIQDYR